MRMHHLLNATALALILGVAPAAAQQSQTDTKAPQAQEDVQKPDTAGDSKSDTMKSGESGTMKSGEESAGSDSNSSDAMKSSDSGSDSMKSDSDSDTAAGSGSMKSGEQDTGSLDEDKPGESEMKSGSADTGASSTANVGGDFINEQQTGEVLASKLIGQPVINANDEKIGDINDLLFSENNELTGVVIGVGGFLGIGEKAVAVSIDSLTFQQNEDGDDVLVASMTQAQLEEAPEFATLEDIELAQNQAQQQAAADRDAKAAPGMAPKPGGEPKAMDSDAPRPGEAPGQDK